MKIKNPKIRLFQLMFYIALTIGTLYMYERAEPATNYFEYYGNVTTKETFTYPETITNYSFGRSDREPLEMNFINELWCNAIDSDSPPYLVSVRTKSIPEYTFANEIPDIPLHAVDSIGGISKIGLIEIGKIRANEQNLQWDMGENIPEIDSTCYITAHVSTPSTLFNISKTISFVGNRFNYVYPDGIDTQY